MAEPAKRSSSRHAVFVRWRPLDANAQNDNEILRSHERRVGSAAQLVHEGGPLQKSAKWQSGKAFRRIFETDATNLDVFEGCITPILPRVLQGFACNFFAYGHTGSGKTYTTIGNYLAWESDKQSQGLVLMSAQRIFTEIDHAMSKEAPTRQSSVPRLGLGVRMFESLGSESFDLLDGHRKCHIRQGGDGKVHSLREGVSSRTTGTSTMHDRSSRTHAILELEIIDQCLIDARDRLVDAESALVPIGKKATDVYIEEMSQSLIRTAAGGYIENPERPTDHSRIAAAEAEKRIYEDRVEVAQKKVQEALHTPSTISLGGKLIFADLAGAEFHSATRFSGILDQDAQSRKEGRQINTDLLALKEVIRAWSAEKSHIPFRSSTLTMVLREHFASSETGLSATILTVTPSATQLPATMNTLKYGKLIGEV